MRRRGIRPAPSSSSTALQILLFYDDLEVVNPHGSRTKRHKVGESIALRIIYTCYDSCSCVFLYTGKSSPSLLFKLVTVVKSVDVSTYGTEKMLKPF